MLEQVIDPAYLTEVYKDLINRVCHVRNYKGSMIQFFEKVTINKDACLGTGSTSEIWQTKQDLHDILEGPEIKVPGVIINAFTATIRTDSVIVDSLLGQSEALDCYNSRLQNAAASAAEIANMQMMQGMEIVNAIEDPKEKAEAYRKVFGHCCEDKNTNVSLSDLNINISDPNAGGDEPVNP